jgi:putative tryptophan/tyrosine transport system substrate-binding protein
LWSLPAVGQQIGSRGAQQPAPGKWRVGILMNERGQKAMLSGLNELGYFENQNLVVDVRRSNGTDFVSAASELVGLRPDVVVTGGTQGALALKHATKDIPIVMTSSDPVGTGLIDSLAQPGGNVTGYSLFSPEISSKRLELMREAIPGLSKFAVLWNSSDPPAAASLRETEDAAKMLGLDISAVAIQAADDLGSAFASIEKAHPDGLVILPSPLVDINAARIAGLAIGQRLPAIYPDPGFARAGGLMSYGPDFFELIRREALLVDRIFRGVKPADLPVEQPTKFLLVINQKTANALGIVVPPILLARADEVIE